MKQLLVLSLALLFYVSSGLAQQPASQAAPQATQDAVSTELVTLAKACVRSALIDILRLSD
jgi:hypothetical protein